MSYGRPPSPTPSDLSSDLELDELASNSASSPIYAPTHHSILGGSHKSSFSPNQARGSEDGGRRSSRMALHRMGLGAARRDRDRHDRDDEDQEALLGRRSSVTSDGTGGGGGEGPSSSSRGRGRRSEEPFLRRVTSRLSIKSRGDGDDRSTSPAPSIAPDFQPSTATRVVSLDKQHRATQHYPPNIISNHKFTPFTFLPLTLYHEFSFFFNLYFLLVALSQIIPALRIGFLSTYIVPLVFVLAITLGKEAHDDIARRRRDTEANSEPYEILAPSESNTAASTNSGAGRLRRLGKKRVGFEDGHEIRTEDGDSLRTIVKKSRDLRVGDVLVLRKDQRVPADVVILKSISNDVGDDEDAGSDGVAGEAFIRTDQLDGETDWKLRVAPTLTQTLSASEFENLEITAAAPSKEVNNFLGSIKYTTRSAEYDPAIPVDQDHTSSVGLSIDNTAWSNTVLASNSTTIAVIIYTGPETRAALSTSKSRSKTGLLEQEINNLTKILCALTFTLSIVLVALRGFESQPNKPGVSNPDRPEEVVSGAWYIKIMRFLILFSTIIPISLRVNLDMGKSAYAWFIEHDKDIEGTVVRTSTIPEELGRVEYLLSDKTGTLTQNDMELKKVHVGTVSYAGEAMEEVSEFVNQRFAASGGIATATDMPAMQSLVAGTSSSGPATGTRGRREIGSRVRDLVLALALCHNVTPTTDDNTTTYQASSPDEIAIVRWTESVGLRLVHRDRKGMKLQSVATGEVVVRVKILEVFPFTSEGKRMGIVVQFLSGNSDEKGKRKEQEDLLSGDHELDVSTTNQSDDDDIWFFQKGADTVMTNIVARNDWLDEECGNMAREGLRTLVIGRKRLSSQRYEEFSARHKAASQLLQDRESAVAKVVQDYLEHDLELLGVTGVEDKLQKDVKPSLELLRNAGIKIWMLTGDKVETARCVAVSAKLVARGQYIHTIAKLKRKDLAYDALEVLRTSPDSCLLIDGESLSLLLTHFSTDFISLAVLLPAVIACRCTPTQKADIARLIRAHTRKRICCIGDGGNDVSMIQAADVGVGIVGKEGRQASLAADFSIMRFCDLTKLLVWHGRNSYKRSAKLAQFVMHRGLVISVCQTMFSIASRFEPIALYQGWLLVGYATLYTMFPVFSLVLDKDVDEHLANLYPELYKELTEGRSLSYRTFFVWVLVSVYQGGIIQGLSQILVGLGEFKKMVSVSFTVLVFNELVMVGMEITTWHLYMILAEIGTALAFLVSIPFLGDYFDLGYVVTLGFLWRVAVISSISLVPPFLIKWIRRKLKPPSYAKVRGI